MPVPRPDLHRWSRAIALVLVTAALDAHAGSPAGERSRSYESSSGRGSPGAGATAVAHPPLQRIDERGAQSLVTMTLPNGLIVAIDSRPGRRTVYCEIGVRVGSRNEPLALAGMSHLLEHLLFKEGEAPGSRKNPAFSKIRAAGGEVNAMTEFERTNYFCDVHADSFEEGWRGLANLVTAVGFDAKDVEVERKVVLEEAALDKNNPVSVASYSVLGKLFPKDALSQPVIGFRKSLNRIRFEDIDGYYRRFYVPGNAYALIVGDVDAEAAARLVNETLGTWAAPGRASSGFPPPPRIAEKKRFVFHTFTHQVYYGIGALTGGLTARDRAALDLLARILDGGRSSRLYRRIVDAEGLTTQFQSASYALSNIGVVAAGGAVDPHKGDRFKAILKEELARLAAEPVGADELALAKKLQAADLVRQFETNDGDAAFRGERLLYGQPISRDAWLDQIDRLTPDDLLAAARARFGEANLREVEVRPARGFGKILAALRYLFFRRL